MTKYALACEWKIIPIWEYLNKNKNNHIHRLMGKTNGHFNPCRKTADNILCIFLIWVFNQRITKTIILILIKVSKTFQKSAANIILNDQTLESLPLNSGTRQRFSL